MSELGQLLVSKGWYYAGECGGCGGRKKIWKNTSRPNEELKINRQFRVYEHLIGAHIVKNGSLRNIEEYLNTLS